MNLKTINIKTYFRLLRLAGWKGYFFITSLGFLLSRGFLNPFFDILLFFLTIALYLGFSFSINECFDTEEDKLNELKKNPIAMGEIEYRNALVFSLSLAFLGTALSLYFGINYFLLYLATILLSFFYSAPPLRFKNKFLLDFISHGLFFGAFLFFLPFFAFYTEIISTYYLLGLSIFCYSLIFEMKNQISDYETDKKAGLKTTACVLGLKKTKKLYTFLFLIFPIIFLPIFYQTKFLAIFLFVAGIFYFVFVAQKEKYRIFNIFAVLMYCILLVDVLL